MRDNTIRRVLVRNGEVETLSPDEVVVQPMDSITIRIDLHDDERSAEGVGRFLADVSPASAVSTSRTATRCDSTAPATTRPGVR